MQADDRLVGPRASDARVLEWAAKEEVEVRIDRFTNRGNKRRVTLAAESQAKSGHDIMYR